MKSTCKYCQRFKPTTEETGRCLFKIFEPQETKADKRSCKWYEPRTYMEADTRFLVICYVRYCLGTHSYAPSECDIFIRRHLKDKGVQAALPIVKRDIKEHLEWWAKDDPDDCLNAIDNKIWQDLLNFLENHKPETATQKGDKA